MPSRPSPSHHASKPSAPLRPATNCHDGAGPAAAPRGRAMVSSASSISGACSGGTHDHAPRRALACGGASTSASDSVSAATNSVSAATSAASTSCPAVTSSSSRGIACVTGSPSRNGPTRRQHRREKSRHRRSRRRTPAASACRADSRPQRRYGEMYLHGGPWRVRGQALVEGHGRFGVRSASKAMEGHGRSGGGGHRGRGRFEITAEMYEGLGAAEPSASSPAPALSPRWERPKPLRPLQRARAPAAAASCIAPSSEISVPEIESQPRSHGRPHHSESAGRSRSPAAMVQSPVTRLPSRAARLPRSPAVALFARASAGGAAGGGGSGGGSAAGGSRGGATGSIAAVCKNPVHLSTRACGTAERAAGRQRNCKAARREQGRSAAVEGACGSGRAG